MVRAELLSIFQRYFKKRSAKTIKRFLMNLLKIWKIANVVLNRYN